VNDNIESCDLTDETFEIRYVLTQRDAFLEEFSEVWEPQTDVKWMTQVFRHGCSTLRNFLFLFTSKKEIFSERRSNRAKELHEVREPQFGHVC
jgi:hypothetical protein